MVTKRKAVKRTVKRVVKRKTTAKKGRTVKRLPQHGKRKSIKADRRVKALTPGRRISKNGKKYTETRRNRSDKVGSRL